MVINSRLWHIRLFSFILIAALIIAVFSTGKLPEVYTAFSENIGYEKVARQLFETYNVMDNSFRFELPDSWETQESFFTGGEILYHLNFISQDKKINGFVQVWRLSGPLKQFIEESEKAATGAVEFKYFNIREIAADNKKGYLLDYSRANQEGKYNRAYEAFIEGYSNKIYRLSFFVKEKEWRKYYQILFDRIIKSIEIKK
ncbi:MAG TPA: PsbP-related protein [Bacillota bacterium]|nr:PsbP-related protein [Bacillota bacterium]